MKKISFLNRGTAAWIALVLSVSNPALTPLYAAPESPGALPVQGNILQDLTAIQIPQNIGEVQETYRGGEGRLVVLIQDAHSVPDAQNSIRSLLGFFQAKYGMDLALLEGTSSALDPQMFRSFPDQELLKKTFKNYMAEGELTGATAAAVFNPIEARYLGLEDWGLYEKEIGFYLSAVEKEKDISPAVELASSELEILKKEIYSPELLEVDEAVSFFHSNNLELLKLLTLLNQIQAPEPGTQLEALVRGAADSAPGETIDLEVKALGEKVSKSLMALRPSADTEKDSAFFNLELQKFQTAEISPQEFALTLRKLIAKYRLPLQVSQSLKDRAARQKKMQDIQGTQLFRELEAYIRKVKKSLIRNNREMELDRENTRLELARRLMKLELTQEDWGEVSRMAEESAAWPILQDRIQNAPGIPELFRLLETHQNFYRTARQRDLVFVENMLKEMKGYSKKQSIVVAGGFHTEGLTEQLKKQGVSYVLVMPRIQALPEASLYREHMQGSVSWKNYFKIENGRVNLYDAFVRGTRDLLLKQSPEARGVLLKKWRDQIIRDLADKGEIDKTRRYLRFIDEVLEENPKRSELRERWLAAVDRFMDKLDLMQDEGSLNRDNILAVLEPSVAAESVLAGALADPGDSRAGGLDPSLLKVPLEGFRSELRADLMNRRNFLGAAAGLAGAVLISGHTGQQKSDRPAAVPKAESVEPTPFQKLPAADQVLIENTIARLSTQAREQGFGDLSVLMNAKFFDWRKQFFIYAKEEAAFSASGKASPTDLGINPGLLEWAKSGDPAGQFMFEATILHEFIHFWHFQERRAPGARAQTGTQSEEALTRKQTAFIMGYQTVTYKTELGVEMPVSVYIPVGADKRVKFERDEKGREVIRNFVNAYVNEKVPAGVIDLAEAAELQRLLDTGNIHAEQAARVELEIQKLKASAEARSELRLPDSGKQVEVLAADGQFLSLTLDSEGVLLRVAQMAERAGLKAYFAGGTVRRSVFGINPLSIKNSDFDLAVVPGDSIPEEERQKAVRQFQLELEAAFPELQIDILNFRFGQLSMDPYGQVASLRSATLDRLLLSLEGKAWLLSDEKSGAYLKDVRGRQIRLAPREGRQSFSVESVLKFLRLLAEFPELSVDPASLEEIRAFVSTGKSEEGRWSMDLEKMLEDFLVGMDLEMIGRGISPPLKKLFKVFIHAEDPSAVPELLRQTGSPEMNLALVYGKYIDFEKVIQTVQEARAAGVPVSYPDLETAFKGDIQKQDYVRPLTPRDFWNVITQRSPVLNTEQVRAFVEAETAGWLEENNARPIEERMIARQQSIFILRQAAFDKILAGPWVSRIQSLVSNELSRHIEAHQTEIAELIKNGVYENFLDYYLRAPWRQPSESGTAEQTANTALTWDEFKQVIPTANLKYIEKVRKGDWVSCGPCSGAIAADLPALIPGSEAAQTEVVKFRTESLRDERDVRTLEALLKFVGSYAGHNPRSIADFLGILFKKDYDTKQLNLAVIALSQNIAGAEALSLAIRTEFEGRLEDLSALAEHIRFYAGGYPDPPSPIRLEFLKQYKQMIPIPGLLMASPAESYGASRHRVAVARVEGRLHIIDLTVSQYDFVDYPIDQVVIIEDADVSKLARAGYILTSGDVENVKLEGLKQERDSAPDSYLPYITEARQGLSRSELRIDSISAEDFQGIALAIAGAELSGELQGLVQLEFSLPLETAAEKTEASVSALGLDATRQRLKEAVLMAFLQSRGSAPVVQTQVELAVLRGEAQALIASLDQLQDRQVTIGLALADGIVPVDNRLIPQLLSSMEGGHVSEVVLDGALPKPVQNRFMEQGAQLRPSGFGRAMILANDQPAVPLLVLKEMLAKIDAMFLPIQADLETLEDPMVVDYVELLRAVAALHMADLLASRPELNGKGELLKAALLSRLQRFSDSFDQILSRDEKGWVVKGIVAKAYLEMRVAEQVAASA